MTNAQLSMTNYKFIFLATGLIISILIPAPISWAKTYLIAENMSSSLNVNVNYRIRVPSGIDKLSVKSVQFPDKSNPASMQKITYFKLTPSVPPTSTQKLTDQWGNHIIVQSWSNPPPSISANVRYRLTLKRYLKRFQGEFPYPIKSLPDDAGIYLQPTDLVQSNNSKIRLLSKKLLVRIKNQVQVVTLVLNFVIDHIRYKVDPPKYDALYTLKSGLGNCQNYAHLAAAILRSGGIPVRIVTGITAKKGWKAKTGTTIWNLTLGKGRHAWFEVYYPNFGWVGYDPQQTLNFVSTRHIAIEVGPDTYSASKDGAVVWTSSGNISPVVEEKIKIDFESDKEIFSTIGEQPSPRNNLFSSPLITAALKPKPSVERPEKPTKYLYTRRGEEIFGLFQENLWKP